MAFYQDIGIAKQLLKLRTVNQSRPSGTLSEEMYAALTDSSPVSYKSTLLTKSANAMDDANLTNSSTESAPTRTVVDLADATRRFYESYGDIFKKQEAGCTEYSLQRLKCTCRLALNPTWMDEPQEFSYEKLLESFLTRVSSGTP